MGPENAASNEMMDGATSNGLHFLYQVVVDSARTKLSYIEKNALYFSYHWNSLIHL